jgi:hypothetical protein
VLEMMRANDRRQVVAAQIASSVAAWAEAGQAQVAVIEYRASKVAAGELGFAQRAASDDDWSGSPDLINDGVVQLAVGEHGVLQGDALEAGAEQSAVIEPDPRDLPCQPALTHRRFGRGPSRRPLHAG